MNVALWGDVPASWATQGTARSRRQAAGITTAAVFAHSSYPTTPSVKLSVHTT